jgi:Flp pilus assembly protein TadD
VVALALAAVLGGAAIIAFLVGFRPSESSGGAAPATGVAAAPATYVGSESCAACHRNESIEWKTSQHHAAMAEATEASVAGQFDGRQIKHQGVTSTFFRRDGKYLVRTDGADGRLAEFEIAYTFGVEPLQQYLVRFPGGRLQALSLAWDGRPQASGGQRWFHLYPSETIPAGDPLHWTGLQQNWNYMCADCHSTNLRKGYDAATRSFRTTWSEISVGCEACHGPASAHVAKAKAGADWSDGYGLTARLDEREGISWRFDSSARVPVRSGPKNSAREIEVCARCHARRGQLTDEWHAGQPFENGFRPSALETLLYYPDGQQRDEVYTYGSFLQSRMHAKGVTCSDCHNPHTGKVRLPGDATCTQCHQDPALVTTDHHFHKPGTTASSCVSCHMPTTTYMVIDPRHDHSFRVPRPDRTVALGVPNACTAACHTGRGAAWAAAEIARRRQRAAGHQTFAEAFAGIDEGRPGAAGDVMAVASDLSQPSIVRASALGRLATRAASSPTMVEPLLADPDPIVRRAALDALRHAGEGDRLRLVPRLLSDPIRSVRIEAARGLLDLADSLTGAGLSVFESAFSELVEAERYNADRPEAQVELGVAWLARGRVNDATAAFREAIAIDRTFPAGYVNLADAYRMGGDEAAADRVLRDAVAAIPADAGVRHALGLSLVRQKRAADAILELREAARLDPANARYGYVLGVALKDTGRLDEALTALARVHARHPADRDTLIALALYGEEAGRMADAREYARRLLALDPGDAGARQLLNRLQASGAR